MNKNENENQNQNMPTTVDPLTLLNVTRQRLMSAVVLNTELEALVTELRARIAELENKS